jgi:hypothetical protein
MLANNVEPIRAAEPVTVTLPATVWKALCEFTEKPVAGRWALLHVIFNDCYAWASDGKVLMRWTLDVPMPAGEYLVPVGKLPAGAESVSLTFSEGSQSVAQAIKLKGAGHLGGELTCSLEGMPALAQVFAMARDAEAEALNSETAVNASFLAAIFKHTAAIMKQTLGKRDAWVRPTFKGTAAAFIDCQDPALKFVVMPVRV